MNSKHVSIAIIVAPLLSLLAWYLVGALLGEKSHLAQPGESYPLVEKSTCRYASGQCELENAELKLVMTFNESVSPPRLELRSSHPLEGAIATVATSVDDAMPIPMLSLDERALYWYLSLDRRPMVGARIRLVVGVSGSFYFADAATTFLQPVP